MPRARRTPFPRMFALLALVAVLAGGTAARVAAQPVIDGSGEDIITFAGGAACAIDRTDPRDDIVLTDPRIGACAPGEDTDGDSAADYYVNGKDLRRFVFYYDVVNRDLYLLFRAEGVIGDVDGNGNPDDSACEPPAGIVDPAGIGSEDRYEARIDRNCDGIVDASVRVENNQVTVIGLSPQYSRFAFSGHDLEVAVYNVQNLPDLIQVSATSSAVHDGLEDDVIPATSCSNPSPSIDIAVTDVYPPWVCSGDMPVQVTFEVTNAGNLATPVTVVAELPEPLVYDRTVINFCSGPTPPPNGPARWGPFTLAPGASCRILFLVRRAGPCEGNRSILLRAEGRIESACVNGGEPIVAVDETPFTIECVNLDCSISASATETCADGTVELCGPDYPVGFFGYTWSHGASSRCTTVGPGTYSLTVRDKNGVCVNTCQATIREIPCGDNCPRGVGFWRQQCAQKDNGSTKYTRDQVIRIAERIDDRSEFFAWTPGTDFDLFCRNLDPPTPMTSRRQAKRQFVAVLANLAASALGLQPARGGPVHLEPSTPLSCEGLEAGTLMELIDEVDAILAGLEGQDLNDPSVKAEYVLLASCLEAINEGTSIPTGDCSDGERDRAAREDGADDHFQGGDGLALLDRVVPNPFSSRMSFAYEVTGTDQPVEIGVYNVAGRLVKSLARGAMPAGHHTVAWDGTDGAGARVPSGVYFVRVRLGAEAQQHRVIFLGK